MWCLAGLDVYLSRTSVNRDEIIYYCFKEFYDDLIAY